MKSKIAAALVLLALLPCLASCRLAKVGADKPQDPDRLIGVFVSLESLNTRFIDDFISGKAYNISPDTAEKMINGDDVEMSDFHGMWQSDGRFYASVTLDSGGVPEKIEFTGIEGRGMYAVHVSDSESPRLIYDDCIDGVTYTKSADNGNKTTFEGKFYVYGRITWFANGVYQTPDNEIYLLPSFGMSSDMRYGEIGSSIISTESTGTVDGVDIITEAFEIEISAVGIYAPEKITLYEMDGSDAISATWEIDLESIPQHLTPGADTQYIIVETQYRDLENKLCTDREILNRGDESWMFIYPEAHSFCPVVPIKLLWE